MSNYTTFPDVIVFPDGTIRLVTSAAKLWTYTNTKIRSSCTASTVADYILSEDSVAEAMEDAGFVVKRERQPVFHYRIKRRKWPKSTPSGDGKVIDFAPYLAQLHQQKQMCRAYGRHRARNWRLMQERDEKRNREEVRQDE